MQSDFDTTVVYHQHRVQCVKCESHVGCLLPIAKNDVLHRTYGGRRVGLAVTSLITLRTYPIFSNNWSNLTRNQIWTTNIPLLGASGDVEDDAAASIDSDDDYEGDSVRFELSPSGLFSLRLDRHPM